MPIEKIKTLRLSEISKMEKADVLNAYQQLGLSLVITYGDTNEQKAKRPIYNEWQNNKEVYTKDVIEHHIKKGNWFGFVVPANVMCLDIDTPDAIKKFENELETFIKKGYVISKTRKGYHFYCTGNAEYKSTKTLTPMGVFVTPRIGLKNFCLEYPSQDKEWLTDVYFEGLPECPANWMPSYSEKSFEKTNEYKKNILEKLVDEIINAKKGTRNIIVNKNVFTIAGIVCSMEPAFANEVKERITDIAVHLFDDQTEEQTKKIVESAWNAGTARPLIIYDDIRNTFETNNKEIEAAKNQAQKEEEKANIIAVASTSKYVPVPCSVIDVETSVQIAISKLKRMYSVWVYNDTLYITPIGTDNHKVVATGVSTSQADVEKWVSTELYFYNFETDKPVMRPLGLIPYIAKSVIDCAEEVIYYGVPNVINGTFYITSSDKVKIKPLEYYEVKSGITQSFQWILENYIDKFTFETEIDRENAIASLFWFVNNNTNTQTPNPLLTIIGYQPGVGKTTFAKVLGLMMFNPESIPVTALGDVNKDEEASKAITAYLMRGYGYMIFDNIKNKVGGRTLEMITTSRRWSGRILGQSKIVEFDNNAIFAATINNAVFTPDLMRRSIVMVMQYNKNATNIDADLFDMENVKTLRGHVYNIVKWWCELGCPKLNGISPETSYKDQIGHVAGILEIAGYRLKGKIIDASRAAEEASTSYDEMIYKFAVWLFKTFPVGVEYTTSSILEKYRQDVSYQYSEGSQILSEMSMDILIPNFTKMMQQNEMQAIRIALGFLMRKLKKATKVEDKFFKVVSRHKMYGNVYINTIV